ncbi:MAG: gliding motility protein GldM [Chitinophagaceae bacterium]|nr:gliding motility protein GldM [Chitinophagaceae bacterium]
MSIPKEPRQLMINLMYLVLTALLALNVSNEILNAFKIVDKSILRSNDNIDQKNKATIFNFDDALADSKITSEKRAKITAAKELAMQAQTMSSEMVSTLENYRKMIIDAAGGIDPETNNIKKQDDLESATRIMIKEGNGAKMLEQLKAFKEKISGLVVAGDGSKELNLSASAEGFAKLLPLNFDIEKNADNPGDDWSFANFNMVPAVAAVTIMDKYINDVKNSESAVMDELWAKAFGEKKQMNLVFTDYAVIVSPENPYLLPGQKYKATMMLGAYNKKQQNLTITVNGQSIPVRDGIATYEATATSIGEKPLTIGASYVDLNTGARVNVTPVKTSYFVGEPQASVSLDKMNVFYQGVPNPITISASGIPAGNLDIKAGDGISLKNVGNGKYEVMASKTGTSSITLVGKLHDGSTKTFGPFTYRLKRLPKPNPEIANSQDGGSMMANKLKSQIGIFARPPEGFEFDVKYNVTSFEIYYLPKNGEPKIANSKNAYLTGPNADPTVSNIMKSLRVGDRIWFENIKAIGPDGVNNKIGTISFNLDN